MPFLGAHESVSGGLHLAFDRIREVSGEALQIFTRNQRQWNAKPLAAEEIAQFRQAWRACPDMEVVSHASYLINLASPKEDLFEKSIQALVLELERCEQLGIHKVVLHPGSHGGKGVEQGVARIIAGLDTVFSRAHAEVSVLIETIAGQGTGIGASFGELGAIIAGSRFSQRIEVCFDTCHVFAAGYDLRNKGAYDATMSDFERQVGLAKITLFHLNDSQKTLGSRVDRHAHIGKGEIGLAGFAQLMSDERFARHSMTLETPKGDDLAEDRINLDCLRSLLAENEEKREIKR